MRDLNTPFLLRRLRQLGLRCSEVAIVPDDVDRIADAVREAAAQADWVFTSGGVGPTHDDVTMQSIAMAFDVPLEEHEVMSSFLKNHSRHGSSPERMRMALLPQGAEVDERGPFPQVRMRNVWIFPGVPRLLQKKFELVAPGLGGRRAHCTALYSPLRESQLATRLEAIVDRYPGLELGSYPQWRDDGYRVLVTLEGLDAEEVRAARDGLVALLGDENVLETIDSYRPEDTPD